MCVHACMLFLFVMGTVEFGAFFLQESDFSPSVRTGYNLKPVKGTSNLEKNLSKTAGVA